MKKITRKEIRQMLEEQVAPAGGPYLIMVVESAYAEVSEVFITKILPEESWWHDPDGGSYTEDYCVNIVDMSAKKAEPGFGLPSGIINFEGNIQAIRHPDAQ